MMAFPAGVRNILASKLDREELLTTMIVELLLLLRLGTPTRDEKSVGIFRAGKHAISEQSVTGRESASEDVPFTPTPGEGHHDRRRPTPIAIPVTVSARAQAWRGGFPRLFAPSERVRDLQRLFRGRRRSHRLVGGDPPSCSSIQSSSFVA